MSERDDDALDDYIRKYVEAEQLRAKWKQRWRLDLKMLLAIASSGERDLAGVMKTVITTMLNHPSAEEP